MQTSRMRCLSCWLAGISLITVRQATAASFQVVSVKPALQTTGFLSQAKSSNPGRTVYRNYPLRALMIEAYDLAEYQVQGPPWISQDRFDIVATKPRDTAVGNEREMLQALLKERFHLETHQETKELSSFVLLPGKDRSKLRPEHDAPDVPGCKSFGTMPEFARVLSHSLNAPVADQTGIAGTFYFILAFSNSLALREPASDGAAVPPPPPAAPPSCPGWSAETMPRLESNIFSAVRNQMGLRLERRGRVRVAVVVVDNAKRIPESN